MNRQETLERAVIGLALSGDPQVMLELDEVRPEHFQDLRHEALWRVIQGLSAQGTAADVFAVSRALPSIPARSRCGVNDTYLLDCLHEAPVAPRARAAGYAESLIQSAGHRTLESALIRAEQLLEATPDPVEADALIRACLDEAAPAARTVGSMLDESLDATVAGLDAPARLAPTPWSGLTDIIGGWRPGALYVVGARPGVGKALWVETPIPTPSGWTTMGALHAGDLVLGRDGRPTRVTQATAVMLGRACYRVEFSDATSVIADADHRWLTETRASGEPAQDDGPRVVTTSEIAATARTQDGSANHALPEAAPLELPVADLPLDPYILGRSLGDGSDNGPARDSAPQRPRNLGRIPAQYLRASGSQRLSLLRGLLDSSGHIAETGTIEYSTVNAALARDVTELARTLGIRPTCTTRQVTCRDTAHAETYEIRGTFTRERTTPRRYVTDVVAVPSVPVRCIQVDNGEHLYLCGDGFVPTHNTIMGLQSAYSLAHQGAVAVSSLEMPLREVHTRLIAHSAQVPLGHLNGQARLTPAEYDRVGQAVPHLRALPMSIDDRTSATVWDVATHARLLARRQPLAGVVVDYMQLMSTSRGDRRSRYEVVSEQSRQLKILAGQLDCPVIALSQLNRASTTRGDGRPSLADLRESGSIEQDADVVLLLHVPLEAGVPDERRLDVLVAKNRHGPTGVTQLERDGASATLNDFTWTPSHT